jgi:hypothetical protein
LPKPATWALPLVDLTSRRENFLQEQKRSTTTHESTEQESDR